MLDKIVIVAIAGNYDWWRVLRFSMYGGLFVAPTLYGWVKVFPEYSLQSTTFITILDPLQISSAMWPHTSLRTGMIKAAVETVSYTPGAMTCFYFIMSLLEAKTVREAVAEVGKKFLPTYKVNVDNYIYLHVYNTCILLTFAGCTSGLAACGHY